MLHLVRHIPFHESLMAVLKPPFAGQKQRCLHGGRIPSYDDRLIAVHPVPQPVIPLDYFLGKIDSGIRPTLHAPRLSSGGQHYEAVLVRLRFKSFSRHHCIGGNMCAQRL